MRIALETLTLALADEIIPIGQESWDECSEIKKDTCAYHGQRGLQIDPHREQYFYLAENDSLIAMTLRDDEGVLRGYALVILYRSLHLKTELCAHVDTFFVQPAFRKSMLRFMNELEKAIGERGISIIGWPVSMSGDLYKILERRGYHADDVVMELKIKDIKG